MMKKTETLGYVTGFVSCLLILLPVALSVLYVRAFGVSVVRQDAWSMVPLFERWSSGTLRVSDFFVQHNQHRSAFPEVVELFLGIVTKYNNVAEMYLIQVCLLITLIVLLLVFRASDKSSLGLFLFVPVAVLIFSLRQHTNMLFGYQINFAFVITFGVLALFLLYFLGHTNFKKLTFVAALISATVATYSVVQGLLVWPAGLVQLLLGSLDRPKKTVFMIVWGFIGVIEWVVYLRGWSTYDCSSFIDWGYLGSNCEGEPGDHSSAVSSLLHVLGEPLASINFFLNLLANSLWGTGGQATLGVFVVGLLLFCLALVSLFLVYKDRKLSANSFWISLLLYAFLILAAITVGRSESGIQTALAPRFTSFAILAVTSIYGLLAVTALERGLSIRRPSISIVLVIFLGGAVLLSAAIVTYPHEVKAGKARKMQEEERAYILATYESQPDEVLSKIAPQQQEDNRGARLIRERAPVLQKLGYNVFSEPQPPYRPLKKFSPEKEP